MPYQNIPRFEPNYGNRYGFRQREVAPAKGSVTQPVPGSPSAPPSPTTTTGGSTRPSQDYHSGPSAESDGNEGIDAGAVRGAAARDQGLVAGKQTPGQLAQGILGFVPGGGLIGGYVGDAIDEATGFGGIPAHERYGAAGTYDTASGGVFDASGQAFDPVTGQGLGVYGNRQNFLDSPYVSGIRANPYSLQSYLSDPVNAPRNTAANAARAAGHRGAQGFLAATRGDRGLYADDELGNVPTPEEAARLAQHVGQTEYGFEEHTVAPDTATNQAIQGIGYTGSGAAPAGSQFSSTGTFSSSHSDDNNDSNIDSPTSSAHSGGSSGVSFADDAAASDSGGGGGK